MTTAFWYGGNSRHHRSREVLVTAAVRYLSKPVELDVFEGLVKSINEFWLTRAKLPKSWQVA